jgi:TRAP-type C4-dicarboxylate transport system substrate-binding protein
MRKKMIYSIFIFLIGLVINLNMAFAETNPIKIKYAHLGPPEHFNSYISAAAVAFKYVMENRSGGRFLVDIYPSGSLGKEIDMLEAVKNNVIQVHSASMGGLHRIFPPALLFCPPYLIKNAAIGIELFDGPFGQKILDEFTEKTGIKGLAFLSGHGYSAFTNNVRQIRTPSDMKGIKFRAADPLQVAMFKALGASAVPIPWPEVYTSLQTGVVNGQTNPAYVVSWANLNEVQKYMTLARSEFGYQWLVCNKQWYDALSPDDKLIVRDAVRAAVTTAGGLGVLLEVKAIDEVKKREMDVYALSDKEILEFRKLALPACLEYLKTQIDPKWVDELVQVVKDTEKKLGY